MIEFRERTAPFPYATVIFDVDSTLATIEGIDELALEKGKPEVLTLTRAAMTGTCSIEDVFAARLDLLQPTLADMKRLAENYAANLTPGAPELMRGLKQLGVNVLVVSGGFRPALVPALATIGIRESHVIANELLFADDGSYQGFRRDIPLFLQDGKVRIIQALQHDYPGRTVMIGDGSTDLATKNVCDFVCFTGVANRPAVAACADYVYAEPDLRGIVDFLWTVQTQSSCKIAV